MTTIPEKEKKAVDLLKYVEVIALLAKESELKKEFLKDSKVELKALSAFLEITDIQSAIFCVILSLNFGHTAVDLDDIAGYIGCSPMSVLVYMPEMDELLNKKIISFHENSQSRSRMGGFNINSIKFYVNREVLDSLMKGVKPKKNISAKEIVKIVADFYNIEEASIYEKTRRKEVVKPRQIVMYILREDCSISFPLIGQKLGGRDHTTVIHSCEKIKNEIKTDIALSQEINQIRTML